MYQPTDDERLIQDIIRELDIEFPADEPKTRQGNLLPEPLVSEASSPLQKMVNAPAQHPLFQVPTTTAFSYADIYYHEPRSVTTSTSTELQVNPHRGIMLGFIAKCGNTWKLSRVTVITVRALLVTAFFAKPLFVFLWYLFADFLSRHFMNNRTSDTMSQTIFDNYTSFTSSTGPK